jgi:hypothetical protein
MDVLTTFIPPIVVFLIFFSAPLFHMILAAGQAVGRLSGYARGAGAAPALCHQQLRRFFDSSVSPSAQALTAGEISLAEIHCYGEATAKRRHSPGTPLSW